MRRGSAQRPSIDRIVVGAAVLGDVERREVGVVAVQPDEQLGEALRCDRPAHVGVDRARGRTRRDAVDGRDSACMRDGVIGGRAADEDVEVVVDADPVERLGDAARDRPCCTASASGPKASSRVGRDRRRSEERVEPPPVVDRVDAPHLVVGAGRVALATHVRRVDHDARARGRCARRASTGGRGRGRAARWWATVTAAFGSVRPGAW